jgi:NAD(P)-dependent dehydrogenase (short-subunit alcohol dehydrogenase family)
LSFEFPSPFDGKVALVTGAASGIGRATALAFAKAGAKVMVADVAAEGGRETARLISQSAGTATFFQTDVTSAEAVRALLGEVEGAQGRLDFACNCAGIGGVRAPTADYPEDTWMQVIAVNLTGVYLCMKHEIPLLRRSGGGVIVNVASVAGVTGFPAHSAYTASKHGVVGLTRTAALEYARAGIRINALCPAYTRTPMLDQVLGPQPEMEAKLVARVPLGRFGTPEEIAAAVMFLCSEAGAFITGQALVMDGGIMAE